MGIHGTHFSCRDSYWILKGLLVSRMNNTAENMCYNLLSLLDKYGHVPNGMLSSFA